MSLSPLSNYEYERYAAHNPVEVRQKLDQYGVAIVPNVLDHEECESIKSGMWDYLEHISTNFQTPISRTNPNTWRSLRALYPLHSMLIQHWGIGQSQFVWNVRQNPKVVEQFAQLWNVAPEELLVSFDGASIHMPPEVTGSGWFKGNSWLHTDQSYTRNDFDCVQGWITANPVNSGDSTLAFLEGSHRYHGDFGRHFGIKDKTDWFKLSETSHYDFYKDRGCDPKLVRCPEGSLVLWDSRLIHCGQEAVKERETPNMRCVVYVCMTPRSRCSSRMMEKRLRAFRELRLTNHYPHNPRLFPKTPRTYGATLPNVVAVQEPVLTALGRRLVGFDN